MKKISLITALAISSAFLTAQTWENNGTGNIYYNNGYVGIGTSHPESQLDVNGDARISNNTIIGSTEHQFTIGLTPGDGATPTVLKIVPTGVFNAGGGGNPYPDDPGPNLTCIDGVIIPNVLATKDVFSVYKTNNLNQNIGNLNMGHDGTKAFLETEGTGTGGPNHPGDLFINSYCQRNVHVFNANTGVPFGGNGTTKIMSIEGRLNVSSYMQIGNMSSTNFNYTNTQLYVYSSPIMPVGIRVRHGGGGEYGVKIIELADNEKGLGVFRGTPLVDGNERFSVQGDGKTLISSTNTDALLIQNANNGNAVAFNVKANGTVGVGTSSPLTKLGVVDATLAQISAFTQSNNNAKVWVMNNIYSYNLGIDNTGIGHIAANINSPTPVNLINFRNDANNLAQVWIGNQKEVTGPHTDFRLAVDGKIVAKSCYITLNDWADFVFDEDYELPKLTDVEAFYKENKHLPEIPSEKEVLENGVELAEMNKLLLRKVEELTIYLVEQQKEIDALKEKLK